MPEWRLLSIVLAVLVLVIVVEMMRRRKLREKYAAMWLFVGLGVVLLGAVPGLPSWLAGLTGVQLAANFLFAVAAVVLLFVVLQLSSEVGHLEEEVRTTVEEIALLRCELEDARHELDKRLAAAEDRLQRS
ncbi:hypothetical protein FHS29_005478 [Saccharothrix tamanrassetensis]|uniref:DUF2304 domain-containing protein n=1 Tax=Saccharothrix tamanrassetensis TaxID=1051531 RepID=A0A841CNI2_9PSEU|nr:DUF2304 domain-containing protein [Saccharothrix tamanrassetensis]MBB5958869.1 hypothetical protein [Saccharothrix tamanrassetensis]